MLYFAASPFISNSPSSKDKDSSMLEASGNTPVNPWTLFPFLLYRLLPTFLATLLYSQQSIASPPLPTNWAKNRKKSTDKTLKKIADSTFTPEGIPRIKIPDSVFKKGANLHQDFFLGVFLRKTPLFSQIQSVLTHI